MIMILSKVTFIARCTCYSPVLCSCEQEMAAPSPAPSLDTLVDSLNKIIQLEDSIVTPGATVQEAVQMRVTVRQYWCFCSEASVCVHTDQVWILRHRDRHQLHQHAALCRQNLHHGWGGERLGTLVLHDR